MDLFGNLLHTAHLPGFDVLYVTKILCMEQGSLSSLNLAFGNNNVNTPTINHNLTTLPLEFTHSPE